MKFIHCGTYYTNMPTRAHPVIDSCRVFFLVEKNNAGVEEAIDNMVQLFHPYLMRRFYSYSQK